MHSRMLRYGGALAFAGVLALAGCSGDNGSVGSPGPAGADGTNGTNGTNGTDGTNGADASSIAKAESCEVCHAGAGAKHQALYNSFTDGLNPQTTKLAATIVGVVSEANAGTDPVTYTSTLTFTASKGGVPLTLAEVNGMKQKRFTATAYDSASKTFTTATAIGYDNKTIAQVGDSFTIKALTAKFAPETSTGMVYLYLGDSLVLPAEGHYNLMDNVVSVAKAYGTVDYVSTANVTGCEKCHPTPYAKHGYRVATVAGLNDFVACKACHTDQRGGTDFVFQILADDPPAAAALQTDAAGETIYSAAQEAKYAYTANIMNDTHMSHAMEFAYPQSMANCVTCHAGKLDRILANTNFKLVTCKSCHPVTAVGGADAKRAPALKDLMTSGLLASMHPFAAGEGLYTFAGECTICHKDGGARTFAQMHTGYNKQIYKDGTTKHSAGIQATVGAATFDSATNILTVPFSMSGAAANAIVKPTVVISLYGYDTKDFIVGGHASQPAPDGKRNLEWTEGASGNSPRLTVTPATAAAGNKEWVAKADLTLWAAKLADGSVKKAEIGVLPVIGLNQAAAVGATNPAIAVGGATATFDLVGNAVVANAYGKAIVDAGKCNNCHEALGTTFHSPAYGSAGVVGCRLCHVVGSGGSHLEMQSRSIDSYVHAIHSFQAFDPGDIDFSDPVASMRYDHHVGSIYPNFTILNCESCHFAGTYEVPDQARSLPGVLSAADQWQKDRAIGAVPAYVTGPASRACGSCHRTQMINADDAVLLLIDHGTGVLDAAIAKIMAVFK